VALAFALYAVAREYIGPAGAAAAVAGVAALLALIVAFAVTRKARPKPLKDTDQNTTTRLIELARERPLVAAGAMAAAVVVLIRNPGILTTVLSAAIAGRAARPDPKAKPKR
jgi:predicted permease